MLACEGADDRALWVGKSKQKSLNLHNKNTLVAGHQRVYFSACIPQCKGNKGTHGVSHGKGYHPPLCILDIPSSIPTSVLLWYYSTEYREGPDTKRCTMRLKVYFLHNRPL